MTLRFRLQSQESIVPRLILLVGGGEGRLSSFVPRICLRNMFSTAARVAVKRGSHLPLQLPSCLAFRTFLTGVLLDHCDRPYISYQRVCD